MFLLETLLAAQGLATKQNSSGRTRAVGPAAPSGAGAANGSGATSGSGAAQVQRPSQEQSNGSKTVLSEKAAPVLMDKCTEQVGGSVYSTGTDDIIVKIIHPVPAAGGIRRERTYVESGFRNGIYLLSAKGERFIGLSSETREVSLGKLPAGELIFAIKTPERNLFQTGPASRNPDHLEHAIIKTYLTLGIELSRIEVWFEDLYGPKRASDRDFNDTAIQIRGGVANNGAVADLLKTIATEKGETRQQAIAALKELNPKAAANAGFK